MCVYLKEYIDGDGVFLYIEKSKSVGFQPARSGRNETDASGADEV